MNGKDYRVKAEHPRRPGTPLVVSVRDAGGSFVVVAKAGDTCEHVAPEVLESMIRNGYVERVPTTKEKV